MGRYFCTSSHRARYILNIMKLLLVIALFGAVQAKPWYYTHPVVAAPVVYHAPTVYASNVCRNEGGAVVPRAEGTTTGIYAFNDAPHTFGFPGLVPAPAAAAEDNAVVEERKKRSPEAEAEADAEAAAWYYGGYYGHPGYYGHYGYGYGLGYGYGYGLGGYYGLGYGYGHPYGYAYYG